VRNQCADELPIVQDNGFFHVDLHIVLFAQGLSHYLQKKIIEQLRFLHLYQELWIDGNIADIDGFIGAVLCVSWL